MRILVVGAAGHLGSTVVRHFAASADVTATTRRDLDVRDGGAVQETVRRVSPDVVINCSAYTDVDRAEDEPLEALEVNAFAVKRLAAAARAARAAFVHYRTDFVFDGTADRPYTEEDEPNPRSIYACSKLIGEWFAREAGRHYVLRVESVFGSLAPSSSPRRTSVDRILDAILEGREARVFVDRTVSPSYSADVARATQDSAGTAGARRAVSLRQFRLVLVGGVGPRGGPAAEPRAAAGAGQDGRRRTEGRAAALLRPRQRPTGEGRCRDADLAGRARAVPAEPGGSTGPSLTTVRPPSTAASVLLPRSRRFRPGTVRPCIDWIGYAQRIDACWTEGDGHRTDAVDGGPGRASARHPDGRHDCRPGDAHGGHGRSNRGRPVLPLAAR